MSTDTQTTSKPTNGVAPGVARGAATWPVKVWAAIGGTALVLQSIIWIRYLASSPHSLTRFRDTDSSAYLSAKAFEIALMVLLVCTVGLTIRGALKRRRMTTSAMLLIAFVTMLWIDPMLNYLRPGFYFSQNLLNVESWVQFIPGQLAPHANLTPVPYVWVTGAYVGFFLPVILANVAILRKIRRRWPTVNVLVLFTVTMLISMPVDIALETVAIRSGVMAYPAASHTWSLWGGTMHQLPIIEILAAGAFWAVLSTLVFLSDERGWTPAERGAEVFRNRRVQTLMRQMALIGVCNVLFLTLPLGIVQMSVAYTDKFPTGYPQHLTGEWCGDQGQPYGPCPGPGVSWKVRVPGQIDPSPAGLQQPR
ncbi:spirocyclase AveC family protein [Mycolicibacterium sp. XJ1819]